MSFLSDRHANNSRRSRSRNSSRWGRHLRNNSQQSCGKIGSIVYEPMHVNGVYITYLPGIYISNDVRNQDRMP